MSFDSSFVIYGFVVAIFLLLFWIIRLEIKIRKLLGGKNASSLEEAIKISHQNIEKLNTFQKQALSYFNQVEKRLRRSVQAIETIRFNPFKGTGDGGNQSFSTTFINEDGKGVVISSLYSRDRVSIFSKPLKDFESTFELTEEEKTVVTNSQKTLE